MEKGKAAAFRQLVKKHYRMHGRHALPWRLPAGRQAYRILVSEVMLQQTQVERVIPYWQEWMREFPNAKALASAPLSRVLSAWQGLGYNRRAKMLHEAAKHIAKHGFPKTAEGIEEFPGVGPYTARAVAAFAYNADTVFIETNIRTAITHHFFPGKKKVADKEIIAVLERLHPKGKGREWYAALMDYGSFLKRSGVRINARAKGYAKQSAFRGSAREARGAILKLLVKIPRSGEFLVGILGPDRIPQVRSALATLTKEGLVTLSRGKFKLPA